MPNINAFQSVAHEKKIFLRFINIFPYIAPYLAKKGASPFI